MGGRKNNKKKQEKGTESSASENNPQTSTNRPEPTNQGSDNRPGSSNNQGTKPIADQFKQLSVSSDKQQQQQPKQKAPEAQKQPRRRKQQKQSEPKSDPQQPSTANVWKSAPNQQQNVPQVSQPPTKQVPKQAPQANSASPQPKKATQTPSSQQSTAAETSPPTNMPHLLCPYKGPGTRGMKFRSLLETNYLKLIINKMKDNAYHYDVVIEPDKPKKHMCKIFQQFCVNNFPATGIAFDGARNAYAPTVLSLNGINREVDFIHPETGGVRKYLVSIKETEDMKIPLNSLKTYQSTRQYDMPKKALQCIEIILKGAYQQNHLGMGIQAARSFYLPPDRREYLGDFFELWLGLFQSTVLGSHIYLNVDVAHKAFPKRYDSLVELLEQIQQKRRCSPRDAVYDMQSHLSGLDVIYKTPGNAGQMRVYKFMGLAGTPNQERFTDRDGHETTVADYFQKQSYAISRPDLPCVKLGNTLRSITVPMEQYQ